jgi:hypothetical protein
LWFDYDSVLPGGANRGLFIESMMDKTAGTPILILSGAIWYNVDGMTLREAVNANKTAEAAADYQVVLEDGVIATAAVARLIDEINRSYPLIDLTRVQGLYQQYIALTDAEKTAAEDNVSIVDLLEAYNRLSGMHMRREPQEGIYL